MYSVCVIRPEKPTYVRTSLLKGFFIYMRSYDTPPPASRMQN